ncbi:MAG: GldM family protein [Brumimicrobium sp.]
MAGGKETPRQKMIGMMYLVLTALLALNVSKEIINAFVTLNDKIELSNKAIKAQNTATYSSFDQMLVNPQTSDEQKKNIRFWKEKADNIRESAKGLVNHLIVEASEMIEKAEGKQWHTEDENNEGYLSLLPLADIQQKDNYDIPTNMFIGSNLGKPKERGLEIVNRIHSFRDSVCMEIASYEKGGKKYSFTPIEEKIRLEGEDEAFDEALEKALSTVNDEDKEVVKSIFKGLTLPEKVKNYNQEIAWIGAQFDHAPLVAAAAIFTSLKGDILRAEGMAAKLMNEKVDAPPFKFNKIEPLTSARSAYINQGDTIDLKVMIAAYDSLEPMKLKYWEDDSLKSEENMKTFEGKPGEELKLSGGVGSHVVYGKYAVEIQGQEKWKEWEFPYTVGKPSGAVSLPEMNVLYRGYDNKVVGAVSGYTGYSLNMTNGSIRKTGEEWIAKPGSGRETKISITGIADDGSKASVGTFDFRVQNMPKPSVSLGRVEDGEKATSSVLRASQRLFAGYPPEIPLNAKFSVISWELSVSGAPRPAEGRGSNLNGEAQRLISGAKSGAQITIMTEYKGPDGVTRRKGAVFGVK